MSAVSSPGSPKAAAVNRNFSHSNQIYSTHHWSITGLFVGCRRRDAIRRQFYNETYNRDNVGSMHTENSSIAGLLVGCRRRAAISRKFYN